MKNNIDNESYFFIVGDDPDVERGATATLELIDRTRFWQCRTRYVLCVFQTQ